MRMGYALLRRLDYIQSCGDRHHFRKPPSRAPDSSGLLVVARQFRVRTRSRYNGRMANHSYLERVVQGFPGRTHTRKVCGFSSTIPFSATKPGFTYLVVRAVDITETPVLEQDLRSLPLDAKSVIELARDFLHNDSAFEVSCYWDLWGFDAAAGKWQLEPQPMEVFCYGEDYDNEFWRETRPF